MKFNSLKTRVLQVSMVASTVLISQDKLNVRFSALAFH